MLLSSLLLKSILKSILKSFSKAIYEPTQGAEVAHQESPCVCSPTHSFGTRVEGRIQLHPCMGSARAFRHPMGPRRPPSLGDRAEFGAAERVLPASGERKGALER